MYTIPVNGGAEKRLTKGGFNDGPEYSPDGKRVVYISYGPEQLEPHEHLPNMPVELWLMDADGENQHKILSLFGGQGSINVNSWAGDSMRFAFVSYAILEDPK